jgi:hypothetical protein
MLKIARKIKVISIYIKILKLIEIGKEKSINKNLKLFVGYEIHTIVDLDDMLVEIEGSTSNPDKTKRPQAHNSLREPLEFVSGGGLDEPILDELFQLVLAYASV